MYNLPEPSSSNQTQEERNFFHPNGISSRRRSAPRILTSCLFTYANVRAASSRATRVFQPFQPMCVTYFSIRARSERNLKNKSPTCHCQTHTLQDCANFQLSRRRLWKMASRTRAGNVCMCKWQAEFKLKKLRHHIKSVIL